MYFMMYLRLGLNVLTKAGKSDKYPEGDLDPPPEFYYDLRLVSE